MIIFVLGLLASLPAIAEVTVRNAWVRATVSGQDTTGAYLTLVSGTDAALTSITSPVARTVELHSMRMDGGVMKMRPVARLELPAGKPVELGPSGYHVMLMGLAHPVQVGQSIPLTLSIVDAKGKASKVQVSATVRPLGTTGDAPPMPMPDHAGHMH